MYLRKELGDGTIEVMKTLKDALDPHGIMNPGKVRGLRYTIWRDADRVLTAKALS
jgi:hypothetical protein